jgi:hypothetical protein
MTQNNGTLGWVRGSGLGWATIQKTGIYQFRRARAFGRFVEAIPARRRA